MSSAQSGSIVSLGSANGAVNALPDHHKPKRVTIGFNAPTQSSPTTTASSPDVNSNAPPITVTQQSQQKVLTLLRTDIIPTSAKELSQEIQSYKSQIPGWSADESSMKSPPPIAAMAYSQSIGSTHRHSLSGGGGSSVTAAIIPSGYNTTGCIVDSTAQLSRSIDNKPTGKAVKPPQPNSTKTGSINSNINSSSNNNNNNSSNNNNNSSNNNNNSSNNNNNSGNNTGGDGLTKAERKAKKAAERANRIANRPTADSSSSILSSSPSAAAAALTQHRQESIGGKNRSGSGAHGTLAAASAALSNAAAAAAGGSSAASASATQSSVPPGAAASTAGAAGSAVKKATTAAVKHKQLALFSHLPLCARSGRNLDEMRREMAHKGQFLHPAIIRLGAQYSQFLIVGSTKRCVALLQAFREVIRDYRTPSNTALARHLDSHLKPQINYLVSCRPLSVSMGNAIRYLKLEVANVSPDLPEDDAKQLLDERLCNYVHDRVVAAATVITQLGLGKIRDGDVILTFGHSTVVRKLLIAAHTERHIRFRVIIVDSRPLFEGKQLLRQLSAVGINCSYLQLNALAYAMRGGVSKVIMGAHALLSNGYVMSRAGSAMVSLTARELGVPVIVCCETMKFSDRVQMDSFVNNELGDPDDLISQSHCGAAAVGGGAVMNIPTSSGTTTASTASTTTNIGAGGLNAWREVGELKLLNLMYDVTPSEFITMVISEVGMIPCTSVPVVLREGVKAAGNYAASTASATSFTTAIGVNAATVIRSRTLSADRWTATNSPIVGGGLGSSSTNSANSSAEFHHHHSHH